MKKAIIYILLFVWDLHCISSHIDEKTFPPTSKRKRVQNRFLITIGRCSNFLLQDLGVSFQGLGGAPKSFLVFIYILYKLKNKF